MKKIYIESFNPYRNIYPEKRLIDRGTLKLIKELRKKDIQVTVLPDNEQPLELLFRKGDADLFSNPVFTYLIGIPTAFAINLIYDAVKSIIKKDNDNSAENQVFINSGDNNQIFNIQGQDISIDKIENVKNKVKNETQEIINCKNTPSPYADMPGQIFLEHEPKIIGWCDLVIEDSQLVTRKAIITDETAKVKMASGELNGASVAGIATKSICSICGNSYLHCKHIAGNKYKKQKCTNLIEEAILLDVSLVKDPVNQECFFSLKNE